MNILLMMAELNQWHKKNKYQQKLRRIFTCAFAKTFNQKLQD